MSEQTGVTRAGYAEIKAASDLHLDSGAWAFFMREIIRLPREIGAGGFPGDPPGEVEVRAGPAGGSPIGCACGT